MKTPLIFKTAVFSDCGHYRYSLTREWDLQGSQLCWIMLNPSKANDECEDPTIRRCVGFAKRWGFGGIVVVNLFALVATYPVELMGAKDPVGPHNDEAILQAMSNRRVICAWGNLPGFLHRVAAVYDLLDQSKTNAWCLGETKYGFPSHPLRLSVRKKMRPFRFGPKHCMAGNDGDCNFTGCPQARDGEPEKTGRTCPLPLIDDRH